MNCEKKPIEMMRDNAIHIHFPNGNGISIIWGCGAYSDNHMIFDFSPLGESKKASRTVEFMLLSGTSEEAANAVYQLMDKHGQDAGTDGSGPYGYVPIPVLIEVLSLLEKQV